jgi:hypothetical protein
MTVRTDVSHSSLRNHTEQTTSDGTTAHGTRELQYALAPTDTYSFYQNFTPIHYGQDVVQVPLLEGAAQEPSESSQRSERIQILIRI